MTAIVWTIFAALAAISSGNSSDPLSAPAPPSEIVRATTQVQQSLGKSFFDLQVRLDQTGLIGAGGDSLAGYFVGFKFVPPGQPDVEGIFVLESREGGRFTLFPGQDLPDCAEHPELCRIEVTADLAIGIARDHGLNSPTGEFYSALGIFEGFAGIAWRVSPAGGPGGRTRIILIDATNGLVVRDYEAFILCGGGT